MTANVKVYDSVNGWHGNYLPADGHFDFTTSDYRLVPDGRTSQLVDIVWAEGLGINMHWDRGPATRHAFIPIQNCETSMSIRGRSTMPNTSSNGSGIIFAGLSTTPICAPTQYYISEAGSLEIKEYADIFGMAWGCDSDQYSSGEAHAPFATDSITGTSAGGDNNFSTGYFTSGTGLEVYFDFDISLNGSDQVEMTGTLYLASDMSVLVTGTRSSPVAVSWAASPPEWKYLIFGGIYGNAGSSAPNNAALMDIYIEEIDLTWL